LFFFLWTQYQMSRRTFTQQSHASTPRFARSFSNAGGPRRAPGTSTTRGTDHHAVLRVPVTATAAEIKKAYHQLAIIHHPDKNPGDRVAEDRFKQIKAAYEALTAPDRQKGASQPSPAPTGRSFGRPVTTPSRNPSPAGRPGVPRSFGGPAPTRYDATPSSYFRASAQGARAPPPLPKGSVVTPTYKRPAASPSGPRTPTPKTPDPKGGVTPATAEEDQTTPPHNWSHSTARSASPVPAPAATRPTSFGRPSQTDSAPSSPVHGRRSHGIVFAADEEPPRPRAMSDAFLATGASAPNPRASMDRLSRKADQPGAPLPEVHVSAASPTAGPTPHVPLFGNPLPPRAPVSSAPLGPTLAATRSPSPQPRGQFRTGGSAPHETAPRPPVRSPSWTTPSQLNTSLLNRTTQQPDYVSAAASSFADLPRAHTAFFHSRSHTPRTFPASPPHGTTGAPTPTHRDRDNNTPYRHRWPSYDVPETGNPGVPHPPMDAPDLLLQSQQPPNSSRGAPPRSNSPFPYRQTPSHLRPSEEDGVYAHDPVGRPECRQPIRVPDADQIRPPSQRKRNPTPGRRPEPDEYPAPQAARPASPRIVDPFVRIRSCPSMAPGPSLSVPSRGDSASPPSVSGSDAGNGLSSDSGEEGDRRPPSPPLRAARHASFWR
jgi:hypothetical protein